MNAKNAVNVAKCEVPNMCGSDGLCRACALSKLSACEIAVAEFVARDLINALGRIIQIAKGRDFVPFINIEKEAREALAQFSAIKGGK